MAIIYIAGARYSFNELSCWRRRAAGSLNGWKFRLAGPAKELRPPSWHFEFGVAAAAAATLTPDDDNVTANSEQSTAMALPTSADALSDNKQRQQRQTPTVFCCDASFRI